jgi:hypothetical protein
MQMQSKLKGIFCNTHIKWKSSKTSIDPYELGILLKNKRNNIIPFSYIFNDLNTRKKLLHGFLNSSSSIDTFKDSYEIDENYSYLFDRIKILCNSLGFHTSKTPSNLIINTKPIYYNKIEVEYAGKGAFVGGASYSVSLLNYTYTSSTIMTVTGLTVDSSGAVIATGVPGALQMGENAPWHVVKFTPPTSGTLWTRTVIAGGNTDPEYAIKNLYESDSFKN